MARMLLRILSAVHLTRLTIAFGAVSDLWFIILLTRATPAHQALEVAQLPLAVVLFAGATIAVGLFAYGASLNDVLDVRHDTTFSPQRPIPAGRIRVGQAAIIAVGALIVGVLASATFGTWSIRITLLVAALLLFYDAAGKFVPAVGFLTVGLIHAGHMLIPNHQLAFMLPVWLVMTHSMAITAGVYRLEEKRPRLRRRTVAAIVAGWLAWSAAILGLGIDRLGTLWPEGAPVWAVVYPVLAVIAFLFVVQWKTRGVHGEVAAEKLRRYGAMWQSLYGASWMLALGLEDEAIWLALFALGGFVAMTAIKEMIGLSGRPVAYR